ncbi:TPA: 1-acyl-sn-glycerol-3-phosphate acyltransferase [Candidatus Scatousia excrementigallinarum]|uniref:1-acyl-sn-glycerol-3-phosphate acyltransferase n=1 Tax=Candidatus Scatousia excrementigallinarum TaxID=2840935 RepID=A0A9D1JM65_9BACT|nr:1-acyl-sn-glycerol-3-phosphate acyltransferase [Candidatus Scatousia excrementigallinarum]
MAKKKKEYTKRSSSQYNLWRGIFQNIVCKFGYMIRFKLVYRLEVHGLENVPKDNEYIVCPNHLSTLDPPLMVSIMPRHVAFMAKKELFDIPFLRWWIDWLGAFAVNRESLGPSTIKTVMEIKKSKWVFGIFPQGTRGIPGEIRGVTKGFAGLAKITKCAILPVGIVGTDEVKRWPFTGKIIVKIGKPIPYSNDIDSVVAKWTDEIQNLTGFTYIQEENKAEDNEVQQN